MAISELGVCGGKTAKSDPPLAIIDYDVHAVYYLIYDIGPTEVSTLKPNFLHYSICP